MTDRILSIIDFTDIITNIVNQFQNEEFKDIETWYGHSYVEKISDLIYKKINNTIIDINLCDTDYLQLLQEQYDDIDEINERIKYDLCVLAQTKVEKEIKLIIKY